MPFEKPEVKMHDCEMNCGRKIVASIRFCMFCRSRLKKEGLCERCGRNPRKPKPEKGKQSKYCEGCQKIISAIYHSKKVFKPALRKARSHSARERVMQTKFGID